jgi:phospholipid/cholesterol/gamma-HCH transport system permease protein
METLGRFSFFALRVMSVVPGALLRPGPVMAQCVRFTGGSLVMVLVIGLSLGVVAWMHLGGVLRRFEIENLLPALLMLAVVVEFGPVSVGLIAAARLAAGIAAELAAMKVTEQLDALELMGVPVARRLLAPRVLACALVLPPLTVLMDYSALVGSFAAERLGGELTWTLYWRFAIDRLTPMEAILATAKTAVFGLLVGLLGCWHGVRAAASTDAVGSSATRAVVASTLSVLVGNVLLVRAIQLAT